MAMYAQDRAAGEKPAKKPTYSHAKIERTRQTSKRVSTTIDPAEVSLSYRRYCHYDFKVTDKMLEEGRQHQGLDLHKPLKIDPKDPFPIPWQIHEAQTRLLFASILDDFDSRLLIGGGRNCVQSIFVRYISSG
mmetsp:Transcript_1731/g.3678  ORF Transcript_1731/g.3678 Transcript_1731/m.3678 type:complete len:133 (+) Transcript_1731:2098-2496(+)